MATTLPVGEKKIEFNSYTNGAGLMLRVQCFLTVRNKRREIACVRLKGNPGWSVPGESIQPNEAPNDAARRVSKMWFDVELPTRIADVQSYPDSGDHKWYVLFIYEADEPQDGLKLLDDTEAITFVHAGREPGPFVMDHKDVFGRLKA